MSILQMFLVVLALVLFLLAAVGVPNSSRFNLIAGGLFFWLLSDLITRVPLR